MSYITEHISGGSVPLIEVRLLPHTRPSVALRQPVELASIHRQCLLGVLFAEVSMRVLSNPAHACGRVGTITRIALNGLGKGPQQLRGILVRPGGQVRGAAG